MPLIAPAWVVAIAAVALAIGAILTAVLVRGAVIAQRQLASRLAEVLDLQVKGLRQALDEQRRAQACQVFIALDRFGRSGGAGAARVTASVHNTSRQPVYDLYVIWQRGTVRVGKPDRGARLMPGQQLCFERGTDESGSASQASASQASASQASAGAESYAQAPASGGLAVADAPAPVSGHADAAALTAFLTFRDSAGVRWTVREDGTLADISPTPRSELSENPV